MDIVAHGLGFGVRYHSQLAAYEAAHQRHIRAKVGEAVAGAAFDVASDALVAARREATAARLGLEAAHDGLVTSAQTDALELIQALPALTTPGRAVVVYDGGGK